MPHDPRSINGAITLSDVLGWISRDEIPWDHAWVVEFYKFDERFTLHDSVWGGIFLEVREGNEAIVVLEWDRYWLPEPVRAECYQDEPAPGGLGNPFLLIRLSQVCEVQLAGYEDPLSGRTVSCTAWAAQENFNILEISDCVGGTVRLKHSGRLEFLALHAKDGHVLDLTKVEPLTMPPPPEAKPSWPFW